MTFDDDFVQLEFAGGVRRYACNHLKLSWPPPERIDVMGFVMVRDSYSEITDEQRASTTHVCRGARYLPEGPNNDQG